LITAGCATRPINPSFPLNVDDANRALTEMEHHPKPLVRPVLIVGGFMEPGLMPPSVKSRLTPLFTGSPGKYFSTLTLITAFNFDGCRQRLIAAVDARYPSSDPTCTAEVDVIAISMGGLAAYYAATPLPDQRRLRIARLFTIASPLRGARLAPLPTLSPLQKDMRPGSTFLTSLPAADYPIIPYTRLGDELVGESNASPPGTPPWWLPNRPFQSSHLQAYSDPRILADIARRLRGEPTFTHDPPHALPDSP
jgi:pimeloyl-ACP methyl ester carboxylesterase